jgi:hypothetical protein
VQELYDKQGADAAWTLGLKLGLKQSTLRSWFGFWQRASGGTKAAPPAAAKMATKDEAQTADTTT